METRMTDFTISNHNGMCRNVRLTREYMHNSAAFPRKQDLIILSAQFLSCFSSSARQHCWWENQSHLPLSSVAYSLHYKCLCCPEVNQTGEPIQVKMGEGGWFWLGRQEGEKWGERPTFSFTLDQFPSLLHIRNPLPPARKQVAWGKRGGGRGGRGEDSKEMLLLVAVFA